MKKKLIALFLTAVMIGSCFTVLADRGSYFETIFVNQKELRCAGYKDTNYYTAEGSSVLADGHHMSIMAIFDGCRVMITAYYYGEPLESYWQDDSECAVLDTIWYNPGIVTGLEFKHFSQIHGEDFVLKYTNWP
jgi:hypothetical protein